MKNIQIKGEGIILRDITEKEAEDVYFWYSDSKDYKHATGLNSGLSLQEFYNMWRQALLSENEFFLSICIEHVGKCLGFIKGEIVRDDISSVYVSSYAVEKNCRRKKIGTLALKSLLKYIKIQFGCSSIFVTVYRENQPGMNFWVNNGFTVIKTIAKKGTEESNIISAFLLKREL